jgi:hypothetical protein
MNLNIKPKEARAIIHSLTGGVAPKMGIQHITVGRSPEIAAILSALEDVKNGHSLMKFWIGDFGSGKSFMLYLLNTLAMKQKFVVTQADFAPHVRLYSNDGKAQALYSALMDNLSIQTKADGGALSVLLEKWLEQVIFNAATVHKIALTDIRQPKYFQLIQNGIMQTLNAITETGAFDFGLAVIRYYEGFIGNDDRLRKNALRWMKGEYTTKTEARSDLGVSDIINDRNYYEMLKNFCRLFVSIGYSGLVINLDEAVNLYNIVHPGMRQRNYEQLLNFYNDCFQGKAAHLFFNIAGTTDVLEDAAKGFYSYDALKTRLKVNLFEKAGMRDYAQPVIRLKPLTHNEIFVLLRNLKNIFDFNYQTETDFTDADIQRFMEEMFNKPGADDFLTPREVIRDFLNILNILRQNPGAAKLQLFNEIVIADERHSASLEEREEALRKKLHRIGRQLKNAPLSPEIHEKLAEMLFDSENIQKTLPCSYLNEAGTLIVTENRLIFTGNKGQTVSFPYSQINEMTCTAGNNFSVLNMILNREKYQIDFIPKSHTKSLLNLLQAQVDILERKTLAAELKYWEKEIVNPALKERLNRMSRIAEIIQSKKPSDGDLLFLRHADTLAKLLNQYKTMETAGIDSPDMIAAQNRIFEAISLTCNAFEQELKNSFHNDMLDIDAESEAYIQQLKIKGLIN